MNPGQEEQNKLAHIVIRREQCNTKRGNRRKVRKRGARRECEDRTNATHSRARIAMLAVVQMVYPTIKSDARLFREIPCFREIQTRRTSNAWAGTSMGEGTSRKLDDPHRRWSFPLSRSLYLIFIPLRCVPRSFLRSF